MTTPTTTATLTVAEADQLADLEAVIAQGLQTFVQVGQALLTIRDNRLYRTSYGTFEEYCRKTWGMSKTHANRVIDSAEVAEVLTPIGVTPATESQARELAPLKDDPDAMRAVWDTANDRTDGKPTAKVIRECREELTAEPEILDAEVVDDVPDYSQPETPEEWRRFYLAQVNEETTNIERSLNKIRSILGNQLGPEFNQAVRGQLDLVIQKTENSKEFTYQDVESVVEGEMESASRVLANDIRLWLNHLQIEPEMDDLSDREKRHVIEGLHETADVLERKLK